MIIDIDPKRLYITSEVLDLLRVSRSTTVKWRHRKAKGESPSGPVFIQEGQSKLVRYVGADLIDYIKKCKSNNKDGK